LVGCNLASDNPTDDNTSTYGAEMLGAVFVHLHDGGFCWVFEGEFKSAVFDVVIGFGLK
jgi:hypothetical protein